MEKSKNQKIPGMKEIRKFDLPMDLADSLIDKMQDNRNNPEMIHRLYNRYPEIRKKMIDAGISEKAIKKNYDPKIKYLYNLSR